MNVALEVGDITEAVTVSADQERLDTEVRISGVLTQEQIQGLPAHGRGILNLAMLTPGIVGRQEQAGQYYCDSFSVYGAPRLSTGSNEQKAAFSVDGVEMGYTEGSGWGMLLTPSMDAVEEAHVTTNPHSQVLHSLWDVPVFRYRDSLAGRLFGGWKLSTIGSFQSGKAFTPVSRAPLERGGDFNADGQTGGIRNLGGSRPDAPTTPLPNKFSTKDWLRGALNANQFPTPEPCNPRLGTLAPDAFREPGYYNIDLALLKDFMVPIIIGEDARLENRGEFYNIFNRVNVSAIRNILTAGDFGKAIDPDPARQIQLSARFIF